MRLHHKYCWSLRNIAHAINSERLHRQKKKKIYIYISFEEKNMILLICLLKTFDCEYTLEPPWRGASVTGTHDLCFIDDRCGQSLSIKVPHRRVNLSWAKEALNTILIIIVLFDTRHTTDQNLLENDTFNRN